MGLPRSSRLVPTDATRHDRVRILSGRQDAEEVERGLDGGRTKREAPSYLSWNVARTTAVTSFSIELTSLMP